MTNSIEALMDVLEFIEENIAGDLSVEEIARCCGISMSSLQKRFKYVFHMTVKDYILRRRFSCAARDLLTTDDSILSISLKYGYSNHESFTRGFQQVWMMTPTDYRKNRRFSGHTPKLSAGLLNNLEDDNMKRIKYDLTELYDVLKERKDNAYVCADIKHLMWINDNLGTKAGDAAILETMRRIDEACNDGDIFLRIGGDEFVVFTNSSNPSHAEDIASKVRNCSDTITVDGKEFTVEVHAGSFVGFHDRINAKNVFDEIAKNIDEIHR